MKDIFFLACIFALSSCLFFPGDKFYNKVPCPINASSGNFEIPVANCKTLAFVTIPKQYFPTCAVYRSDRYISYASFTVSYPDFQPIKSDKWAPEDNLIRLDISPTCVHEKPVDEEKLSKRLT